MRESLLVVPPQGLHKDRLVQLWYMTEIWSEMCGYIQWTEMCTEGGGCESQSVRTDCVLVGRL